jgi:adenylate kinase family enzyme
MKKPLVVNLTGAPGAGKSTGAAAIFAELKKRGVNAELVTEFAKDKTWEHNATALNCQEYVFGKQSYRLARCRNDVEVIVTDSPLPLGLIYNTNPALDYHFTAVVLNVFNTYENINFFINRVKPYNPKGRNQTAEESDQLSVRIKDLYKNLNISYTEINGDNEGYAWAVEQVLEYLDFIKKEPVVNE